MFENVSPLFNNHQETVKILGITPFKQREDP